MQAQRLRAGSGMSSAQEAATAGREAAAAALAGLQGHSPAVVLVFTTPRYDLAALLGGIRSLTGDALLVGATGSGEFLDGRYLGFGGGVAVLALSAGPYRFGTAAVSHIRGDLDRAGQALARESRARAGASPHAAILVLADMLVGDLQELVQGVYRVTGPSVPMVGGLAGDELKFIRTFVFHGGDVIEEGAVALWIAAEQPLQVVTRHGWEPIGVPLLVTRSEGRSLLELDSRPAVEALAALSQQPGLSGDALQFVALGLSPRPGEAFSPDDFIAVQLLGVDEERGSLETGIPVPEGHSVSFTLRDGMGARRTLKHALDRLGASPPAFGVYFDCASRGTTLYGVDGLDLDLIEKSLGSFPLLSLRTSFELGPAGRATGVHLFTGVLALGDR